MKVYHSLRAHPYTSAATATIQGMLKTNAFSSSPRMVAQRQLLQQQFPDSAPVVQLKYSASATNPAKQKDAISSRNGDNKGFNVATVGIYGTQKEARKTKQSIGDNASFHAERNALVAAMLDLSIDGFDRASGKTTGIALNKGGITTSIIYTERPPCPSSCEPFLQAMEQELTGDVMVSYSSALEDWYTTKSKSERNKFWKWHLELIGEEQEEEEEKFTTTTPGNSNINSAKKRKRFKAPRKITKEQVIKEKKIKKEAEESTIKKSVTILVENLDFSTKEKIDFILGKVGIKHFDWKDNDTKIVWAADVPASEVINILNGFGFKAI